MTYSRIRHALITEYVRKDSEREPTLQINFPGYRTESPAQTKRRRADSDFRPGRPATASVDMQMMLVEQRQILRPDAETGTMVVRLAFHLAGLIRPDPDIDHQPTPVDQLQQVLE